jgi:adenine-specific DNA-methyltransferase
MRFENHQRHKTLLSGKVTLSDYKTHQSTINNNLKDIKKDYGIFFTPERIVDFMVNLIDVPKYQYKNDIKIL